MKTNKVAEWFRSVFKGTENEPAKLLTAMKKNSVSSVLSSIISILIGMVVGSIVILIISVATDNIPISQAGDAIKIVFLGCFPQHVMPTGFYSLDLILSTLEICCLGQRL